MRPSSALPPSCCDRAAVRDVAPYLADDVTAALSIPGEGVLDPFWLTRAYADAAIAGGAELRLGHAVVRLGLSADTVTVRLADGSTIEAEQVVDAAGLHADEVAGLVGDTSFGITPRKGQFLVSEEAFGVDRIVLPIPGPHGKGMLVTPIVFGGLLLGPTAVDAIDKDDRSTDPVEGLADPGGLSDDGPRARGSAARPPVRGPSAGELHPGFHPSPLDDLRPALPRGRHSFDRDIDVAGCRGGGRRRGPGSPRLASTVAPQGAPPPLIDLPEAPGEIVCLCRSISRGEIEAACRHTDRSHAHSTRSSGAAAPCSAIARAISAA